MAGLTNSFETGLSTGTDITTANSDDGSAGDAFNDVFKSDPTCVADFSSTQARDALSAFISTPGGSSERSHLTWNWARTEWWGRVFFYIPSLLGAVQRIVGAVDGSSNVITTLLLSSSANVRVLDSNLVEGATSSAVVTAAAWHRLEWRLVHNATSGLVTVRYYGSADASTPDEEFTASNIDTGGASDLATVRLGLPQNTTSAASIYLDDVAVSDEGWIGADEPPATTQRFPIGMLPQ